MRLVVWRHQTALPDLYWRDNPGLNVRKSIEYQSDMHNPLRLLYRIYPVCSTTWIDLLLILSTNELSISKHPLTSRGGFVLFDGNTLDAQWCKHMTMLSHNAIS
jgi:hypothetical protein